MNKSLRALTDDVVSLASQKVNQRNVPGIDNAYLAMDTEEGVEVVWNEVMFSERKNFKLQEVRRSPSVKVIHAIKKLPFLMFSFQFKISRWDQGFLYVRGCFRHRELQTLQSFLPWLGSRLLRV